MSSHQRLVDKAVKLLQKRGVKEIYTSPKIPVKYKKNRMIPDIVGIKDNYIIAIECGTLSRRNKLDDLKKFYDEVIHFPYPNNLQKNIHYYEGIEEDLDNMLNNLKKDKKDVESEEKIILPSRISFIGIIAKMGDRRIITIPSKYHKFLDRKTLYLIELENAKTNGGGE